MATTNEPTQTIEIDHVRRLVIVTASGFFTPEATHKATMETRRAIKSLGRDVGKHVTLYDMREVSAVPAETVDLMRMGFANPVYKPIWARKVAFVARSVLLQRQIDRIRESRPDIRIFTERDEALDWLLEH
ncbi:hypothetical protein [Sphingomonas sp. LT1P40]|uniref:hypothetical protein n=1 Tax=Alteristakelama amylovorans TaxID=3096166 RepID=UPI002FC8B9C4